MKPSIRSLFFIILACAIVFSISAISVEWLLTDSSIFDLEWRRGFEIGSMLGSCVGAAIWLMYKFNIR